jgi:CRP/FNR family transcriptional regulator, anaerobic regulatory protein
MLNEELWDKHFPDFIRNKDAGLGIILDNSNLIKLPAGQQVFYPGSNCDNYLLVLSGEVKIQILSESGREILLYHVRPGDSCVLTTSCLLGGDSYPAEGITETEVTAFVISAEVFHRCLDLSAYFREFVFKNFSSRLSTIISRMEAVVFESIDKRLAKLLIESGHHTILTTHQALAYELGSAREVISRHLKHFESYGWVALKRGQVEVIDFEALKRQAETSGI